MPDESDGSATSDQTSHEEGLKGQKMVIYMPQGAVIVERIDVDEHVQPVEVISKHVSVEEHVQPVSAVIPERTNAEEDQILYRVAKILDVITERTSVKEQVQPVSAVIPEPKNTEENQLLYRMAQLLDVISVRMVASQSTQPTNVTTGVISADEHTSTMAHFLSAPFLEAPNESVDLRSKSHHDDRKWHHIKWTRERHINWMHLVNIIFVGVVVLSALIPTLLLTRFNVSVEIAGSNRSMVGIHRGDLLISKFIPFSKIRVGDVVLLRQKQIGHLRIHQIQSTSTSSVGNLTTFTTDSNNGGGTAGPYVLDASSDVSHLTRVIPGIGNLTPILSSAFLRIGGGFLLLILNLIVYIRRRRGVNGN